jgi:hypothetical protein
LALLDRAIPEGWSRRRFCLQWTATVALFAVLVALYFKLPWVDWVMRCLEWVQAEGALGIAVMIGLHIASILLVFGPAGTVETAACFLFGWVALSVIVASYVVCVLTMLLLGQRIPRTSRGKAAFARIAPLFASFGRSRSIRTTLVAIRQVLASRPCMWLFLLQHCSVVQWKILTYAVPYLAPHVNLVLAMLAIVCGRLPRIILSAFMATTIDDLHTLTLTGASSDTPVTKATFWTTGVWPLPSLEVALGSRRCLPLEC